MAGLIEKRLAVSQEGVLDFLFGKKSSKNETPSLKKLERLEEELKKVTSREALDVANGRSKPSQEVLDKLMELAEKHAAPSMVYKQNRQLFDILVKLVKLPEPKPYWVYEELSGASSASEAEKIAKDFIRVMEPQVKLMSQAKNLKIYEASEDQLFADVSSGFQANLKFAESCRYDHPTPHETYLAACLAQDFGYPASVFSNREGDGVSELFEQNETLFKSLEKALDEIADEAGAFEMCWMGGDPANRKHFYPGNDDVDFLVRGRCILLDYVLDLKIAQEDLDGNDEEAEKLFADINTAMESLDDLELLVSSMEAAQADPHFGKYNLPLYKSMLDQTCAKLQLSGTALSVESFGPQNVLSTEGVKEVISKLYGVIKELLARLVTWFKNTFTAKNAVMLRIAKGNVNALSKLNKTSWNGDTSASFKSKSVCGLIFAKTSGHCKNFRELKDLLDGWDKQIEHYQVDIFDSLQILKSAVRKQPEDQEKPLGDLEEGILGGKNNPGSYVNKAREFMRLAGNEQDKRPNEEKDYVVLDSLGSFEDMKHFCQKLEHDKKVRSMDNGLQEIIDTCDDLIKKVNKTLNDNPNSARICRHVQNALSSAYAFNHLRAELLFQTHRALEVSLRAGAGDKNGSSYSAYQHQQNDQQFMQQHNQNHHQAVQQHNQDMLHHQQMVQHHNSGF